MKKNASLSLIEQTVMLLILAVAAAICLRLFAWADTRSLENARKDQAMLQLQSAAEVLKSQKGQLSAAAERHGGHLEDGKWVLTFDGFSLQATVLDTGDPLLGGALLEASGADGSALGSLEIYWQEDAP